MNKIKVGDVFLESTSLVAQTFRVNNLGDITTRQGGSSNNFTFPLTSTNRKALGFPEDLNNTSRSPYRRLEASLFENNSFISKGVLKINKVTNTDIEATFFSDNVGFFNAIKGKTLKDLFLPELNHEYLPSVIRDSWFNTDGYIYPIIDYGEFTNANISDPIDSTQLYPAVYVKTIIDSIFKQANYEFQGELLSLPEYHQMIIPFSDEDFVNGADFIIDNTVKEEFETQSLPIGSTSRQTNLSGNPNFATIPFTGQYTLRLVLDLDFGSIPSANLGIDLEGSAGIIFSEIAVLENNAGVYSFNFNVDLQQSENDFFIKLGSNIPIDIIQGQNSFYELVPTSDIKTGQTISIPQILPNIKQSDFLKYIFNVFGIIATTDRAQNLVTLDLFRNIRNRIPNAKDWSAKIDILSSRDVDFTELLSEYASDSRFEYENDDNDLELKTYQDSNNQPFGSGSLLIDNEHLNNIETVYEAPFSSTINVLSFSNSIYIPQINWKDELGEKVNSLKPRIALIEINIPVSELTAGQVNSLSVNAFGSTVIPFCWFVKAPYTVSTDKFTQSLSFGDITFTEQVEGTLSQYWEEYRQLLSNVKYLTANFALNAADIANLDFKTPVYIDYFKSYFYINAVKEFTGSEQLTECELVRIPT